MPPKKCCCCPECDDGKKYSDKDGNCCGCCGAPNNTKAITTNNYERCNCCCNNEIKIRNADGTCPPCGDCPPCLPENKCSNGSCPEKDETTGKCDKCPCENNQCWNGSFPTEPNCECPPIECPGCIGGYSAPSIRVTIPTPKCCSSGFLPVQQPVAGDCFPLDGIVCPPVGLGSWTASKSCGDLGGTYTLRSGGTWCYRIGLQSCWVSAAWSEVSGFVPWELQNAWKDNHPCPPGEQCFGPVCLPGNTGCYQWIYQGNFCHSANASAFAADGGICNASGCPLCDGDGAACENDDNSCKNAFCDSFHVNANNHYKRHPHCPTTIVASLFQRDFGGGVVGWSYSVVFDGLGAWQSASPVQTNAAGEVPCGGSSVLEFVAGQCGDVWRVGCGYQSTPGALIEAI